MIVLNNTQHETYSERTVACVMPYWPLAAQCYAAEFWNFPSCLMKTPYPLKSKVQCFVDPENPENAVLERSLPSSFYFIFLPITLLFVIIGVVILVNGVRDVYKSYRRRF